MAKKVVKKKKKVEKKVKKTQKLNIKNLLTNLEKGKPALAKKDIVESLTHYLIGNKTINTYNDKMLITIPYNNFDCEPFSVKAQELIKTLKSFKSKECTFNIDKDKSVINFKDYDTESQLTIHIGENTMLDEVKDVIGFDEIEFKELNDPEWFINSVYTASLVSAKEITDECIYCVNVTNEVVQGTDSYRISSCNIEEDINDFLIPASVAVNLIDYNIIKIGFSDEWVHFMTDEDIIISCRIVLGEYPDLTELIENENGSNEIVLPDVLKEDLKNVAFMCSGEFESEKSVQLNFNSGVLNLVAKKDTGYIKKKYEHNYKGDNFEISVNPNFLAETLKENNTMYVSNEIITFVSDRSVRIIAVATT